MPAAAVEAFGRVLVAMVTPLDAELRLDLPAAQRLAEHLVASGCDGLVVSGTTGESPTTTAQEKSALLRAVVEAVGGRARVVAGVGTNDTTSSTALARDAAAAGAHGLLVVTPYYSKPPAAGLLAHFRAVADATELPVMLYDIPGRTGLRIPPEVLRAVGEHPRVLAVKDATGDLATNPGVLADAGLAAYSGDDALTLGWLAYGAVGVVSVVGHVAPRQVAALVAAAEEGDLLRARQLHVEMAPAERALMRRTQGAVAAKAGLVLQGVLPRAAVRLPLSPLDDDDLPALRADLEEAGLL